MALELHNRVGGSVEMNTAILTEEYRAGGFVVARGLFGADLLRDVTAEVERVVQDTASTADHGRVYFDDEPVADGIQYIDKPPSPVVAQSE